MLSIFPSLLILGIFAPFILRITIGVYFFYTGYEHLGKGKEGIKQDMAQKIGSLAKPLAVALGVLEVIIGLSLVAGFLTQIIAILGMVYMAKLLWFKKECPTLVNQNRMFYIMIFAILLSLLITGPGAFAIDLPF